MKHKWIIGVASAAVVATCAVTAFAGSQAVEAVPANGSDVTVANAVCAAGDSSERQQVDVTFPEGLSGSDSMQTSFTVEDGKIFDANGNVIGETGGTSGSVFTMMDDDGNPVQITVTEVGEADGRTMYTIAEETAD